MVKKKIKVLGLGGSPRPKSNSSRLIRQILKGAQALGAQTELINIAKLKVNYCDGCLTCDETSKCHFNDGMNKISQKMTEADGFVLGTPARFDNVSGHFKNFIDRTNPLAADERLKGKKAVLVTVGYWPKKISQVRTLKSLKYFCAAQGIKVIGSLGVFEKSGQPGMVEKKKRVLKKCHALGQQLARSLVEF